MNEATQDPLEPTATMRENTNSDDKLADIHIIGAEISLIATNTQDISKNNTNDLFLLNDDNVDNDDENNESDDEDSNRLSDNETNNLKEYILTTAEVCRLQRSRRSDNMKCL